MARRQLNRSAARKQSGNLCDISVNRLLMLCRGQMVTGTLAVDSWGHRGRVTLTDGDITCAEFGDLRDTDAIRELSMIRDGMFTLHSQQQISLTPSQCGAPAISDSATQIVDTTVRPTFRPPPIPAARPVATPPPVPSVAAKAAKAPMPTMQMVPIGGLPHRAPHAQANARQAQVQGAQQWTPQWIPQPAHAAGYVQGYAQPGYYNPMTAPRPRIALPSPQVSFGILCLTMLFSIVAIGI